MGLTVMYRVFRKGNVRYFIREKMCELTESIPLINRNAIAGFPVVDGGKIKGACDESIGVCEANPLAER